MALGGRARLDERAARSSPTSPRQRRRTRRLNQLQELASKAFTAEPGLFDTIGTAIATAQAQTAGAGMGWAAGAPGAPAPVAGAAAVTAAARRRRRTSSAACRRTTRVRCRSKRDGHVRRRPHRDPTGAKRSRPRSCAIATATRKLLTMKGYPSADGKRIYAQMFAPGYQHNFIAARAHIEGDSVYLATIGTYGAIRSSASRSRTRVQEAAQGRQRAGPRQLQPRGSSCPAS